MKYKEAVKLVTNEMNVGEIRRIDTDSVIETDIVSSLEITESSILPLTIKYMGMEYSVSEINVTGWNQSFKSLIQVKSEEDGTNIPYLSVTCDGKKLGYIKHLQMIFGLKKTSISFFRYEVQEHSWVEVFYS